MDSSLNNEWHLTLSIHAPNDEVNEILTSLPQKLKKDPFPFQMDDVSFGLRRGARCFIEDEMGIGETTDVD